MKGINLQIRRSEVVAIMGPSGCGKTTLLNCLSGLDKVTSGTIRIAGKDILSLSDRELTAFRACEMGFVFQSYNLLPVLTGLENVELPSDFSQVYGDVSDLQNDTVQIAHLGTNDVVLSATVARLTDVRVGDTLQISTEMGTMTKTVKQILASDVVVTSGELLQNAPFPEIFLPLATLQELYLDTFHQGLVPNTICVRNDDAHSQAVLQALQHIFHVAPLDIQGPIPGTTSYNQVQIHPLQPGVVGILQAPPFSSGRTLDNSSAGRQYTLLLPAFTWLLVGAGMLLLVLLCLLLAAERKVEAGVSRAIGLQRNHLVQMLLMECSGYGVVAALIGVPLGIGAILLENARGLIWGSFSRGPLCLLLGAGLLLLAFALKLAWLQLVGGSLMIAGSGLLLTWLGMVWGKPWHELARRLGYSALGLGWLLYGGQSSTTLFLAALAPVPGSTITDNATPQVFVSTLLQVAGIVVLAMTNIDILVGVLSFLFRRTRGLAPISRASFVYPLTFRFRTQVTVTLLSMITFLIMLLITNNLGQVQQAQVQVTAGNFIWK